MKKFFCTSALSTVAFCFLLQAPEAFAQRTAWTTGTAIPQITGQPAAVDGGNGNIYLFGGYGGSTVYNTTWRYEIATGTYTSMADMPAASRGLCGGRVNSTTIVMTGGYNSGSLTGTWIYDIPSNTWTTGASNTSGWECAAWLSS